MLAHFCKESFFWYITSTMDKENVNHGHSYQSNHFVVSSRHVPAILRRRRRSQYRTRPQPVQRKLDLLPQQIPLKPLTQLQTQALENCNRIALEKAPKNISPPQSRQQSLKRHQDQGRLGLETVPKTMDPDLQISRKRLLEDLLSGRYKRKAWRIDGNFSASKRWRSLPDEATDTPNTSPAKRSSSFPQTTGQNVALIRRSEVVVGLRRLLTGTSHVLNYLSEQADGRHEQTS